MAYQTLTVEIDDYVALIRLNRPEALNALNAQLMAELAEALAQAGVQVPLMVLGLSDQFIEHGDPAKLLALQGLDAPGIEARIRQRFMAQ